MQANSNRQSLPDNLKSSELGSGTDCGQQLPKKESGGWRYTIEPPYRFPTGLRGPAPTTHPIKHRDRHQNAAIALPHSP